MTNPKNLFSGFEEFICPLSPGLQYPSNERVFVVHESKLRELLTSCAKCGFKINQNLIREGKNTGSQLISHTECEKGNFLHLISILGKLLQIQKLFTFSSTYKNLRHKEFAA